ncbi:MAG: flagellar basal body-associated FliL family protein [Bacteriovoracales bacterium]|nr:flagellar basal body-associated FliL family protein [Bacteriovoracales bacterium]
MESFTAFLAKVNAGLVFILTKIIPGFEDESVPYQNEDDDQEDGDKEDDEKGEGEKDKKKVFFIFGFRSIALVSFAILSIGGSTFFIYKNSREIIIGMEKKSNESDSFLIPKRPPYFRAERKQTYLSSLEVPIYFQKSPSRVYSLRVEFIFETSNRYLKRYIENHEHEIRDCILTSLEPITQEFVLTKEGFGVIKLKVLDELNKLISKKKIKGRIKNVSIDQVLSS